MKRARYVLTTVIITAALFVLSAAVQGLSVKEVLTDLPARLYVPHYNTFKVEDIGRFNALLVFYAGWAVSFFVCVALDRFLRQRAGADRIAWVCGMTVFVLFTLVQMTGLSQSAGAEWKDYSGKTIDERCEHVFGNPFRFARSIRRELPAGTAARLLTSSAGGDSGYSYDDYVLMYHAYPVNLVLPPKAPANYLVLFRWQRAAEHVPAGFQLQYEFDAQNAIAVRQGPL